MKGFRQDRLSSLIKQSLAEAISREYPSLAHSLFSITYVQTAADMSWTDIYCTSVGEDQQLDEHLALLQREASHLRYLLSQSLHLKKTPSLRFRADQASKNSRRIETLLNKKV